MIKKLSSNKHTHLGGALPVRSKGGIGKVSVNTGREVAIVNIPLRQKILKTGPLDNAVQEFLLA